MDNGLWVLLAMLGMMVVFAIFIWATVGCLQAMVRSTDRQDGAVAEMAMQLMEKLTTDPEMAARLHARERMYRQSLQASLEREAIRRESPPPVQAISIEDPDGVPARNIEDARFQ